MRAALIDRDRLPKWNPASLAEVTDAMVNACFATPPEGEIDLQDRWTLVD
ncbi:MAG: enoyl-CoA hydratase/isomerase family protein [Rhodomicrobium sp.]|nr:enoyl-CoA hydratase/isomerase family protein [Rhodomicrobium sp.]